MEYRKTSDIIRTLVGNIIVDQSDVIGTSFIGVAPTTYSFSTQHLACMDWAKTTATRKRNIVGLMCLILEVWRYAT